MAALPSEPARRIRLLRRLGVAVVAMTFALMVLGSWVKATGSGLACPDWPACYGQWFPPFPSAENGGVDPATGDPVDYSQAQILYEWTHRLVASLLGLPLLAFAALAVPTVARAERVRADLRRAWLVPPAVLAGLLLVVAGAGALAGRPVLRPVVFLVALVGGSALLWFLAGPLNPVVRAPSLRTEADPWLGRFALAALVTLFVQVLLGGITVIGRNDAPLTTAHLATATAFLLFVTLATAVAFLRPGTPAPPPAVRFPGEEHA